jgi:8-oxo-dGTP pyrophosphatase MutT (NUDIX family)
MSDLADPARRPGGEQRIPRPDAWRALPATRWTAQRLPSAAEVGTAVAAAALDRLPLTPTFPDARPSAVLITLLDGPRGAEVLLTKRSKELRTHSGEISFPGGRIDAGETPVEAALREAHEEVGLPPALVHVHGHLTHLSTVVSRSYIVPVVATVDERPDLTPHDREVARILWVPLAELVQPTTYREEWWGTPPLDRRMHFFELDDETVWGATAFMLYELLTLVYGPPATRTAP